MLRCINCFYHLSQLWSGVSIPKCERELQEFLLLMMARVMGVSARQELWEFVLLMARVTGVSAHDDGSFFRERLFHS